MAVLQTHTTEDSNVRSRLTPQHNMHTEACMYRSNAYGERGGNMGFNQEYVIRLEISSQHSVECRLVLAYTVLLNETQLPVHNPVFAGQELHTTRRFIGFQQAAQYIEYNTRGDKLPS
eukprot:scpid107771/ scgid30419/ 